MEIIQSWILRFFPKVHQVIYTLDTICDPNIMTLAQTVLEIFFHYLPLAYIEKNGKGSQFSHGFRKFYQQLIRLSTSRIQSVNQIHDPSLSGY